ncbi:HNH endonuclease signature motif containing protein [Nocardioides sp.]|uniref:HNH endonuclease signature motif containing protein n=1 Tax=Nocardioides sp. TaxID=35761 RepID=UPI00261DDC68|nr:HNH endonuclease signature motif containing protein [Nocardioides sp.]
MTSHTTDPHPAQVVVRQAEAAIAALGEMDAGLMEPAERARLMVRLSALMGAVTVVRAGLITAAAAEGGVRTESGARAPGWWIADETRRGRAAARDMVALADALVRRPHVATALRTGAVDLAQAPVICRAIEQLPDHVSAEVVEAAEKHLVDLAGRFDPRQLRILGRRVLEAVDPDAAEAHEGRLLEREDAIARTACRLSLRSRGDGTTRIWGVLPDLAAIRLANYLHTFTSPRHHSTDTAPRGDSRPTEGDVVDPADTQVWRKIPYGHRLGKAFCEFLDAIDPTDLPDHGGESTQLIVTMSLEDLRREVGAATVLGPEGAERISAAEARRLACRAGIIPAVLGGKDEVLNLGRERRLASLAQRRALRLRHHTCQATGCTRPARWCEAHHLTPWAEGGTTDLNDLVLLCSEHHHVIHDPQVGYTLTEDGEVRFHRRE